MGPPPTPEGFLIRRMRETAVPRLSIRAAASRVGISPETWGSVERGYRYSRTGGPYAWEVSYRQFSAPAATVAKMANAVGLTPERLAAEGQRPDAAEVLSEIIRQDDRMSSWDDPRLPSYVQAVWAELGVAKARYGESPSGSEVFPNEPLDAQTWDYVMRGPISEWRVIRYMALLRIIRDDILKEGRAAGLRPRIVAQRSQYAFGRC
jgi:hypothetical protein